MESVLRKWARVSAHCESAEDHLEVRRLAEVVKAFSLCAMRQAVQQHAGLPLLLSVSADGTPLRIKKDVVESQGDTLIRRRGGHPVELLVLRGSWCVAAPPVGKQSAEHSCATRSCSRLARVPSTIMPA